MPAKIMPTTWLLVAILLMVALWLLVPGPRVVPRPWNVLGLVPVALGVWLNLAADGAFHRAGTTVKPGQVSSTLLTEGAFRLSRNPMYLGFVLILLGIAVLMRALTPLAVVVAFAALMHRAYIRGEERILAEAFGAAWQAYQAHTRRWL